MHGLQASHADEVAQQAPEPNPPLTTSEHTSLLLQNNDKPSELSEGEKKRAMFHLLFSSFLFVTAISISVSVRPKIILDGAGGNASYAAFYNGLVDCISAVLSIVLVPLLSTISDITGRRPIFLLCHFGELFALLIIAQFTSSLLLQFPAYMLFCLSGAYLVISSTIVADLSADNTQQATSFFGISTAVAGAGFLIGPTIGGLVEERFYFASSLHVASAVIAVTIAYVYFFMPETLASAPSLSNSDLATDESAVSSPSRFGPLRQTMDRISHAASVTQFNPVPRIRSMFGGTPALRWIGFAIAASAVPQSGFLSFFFLYATKKFSWTAKDTGYFFSTFGVALIVSQAVLAPLTARLLGERRTIVYSIYLHAVHFYMYGIASNTTGAYLSMFVGTFAFVYDPVLKAVLSKQTTWDKQGALQGNLSVLKDAVKPFGVVLASSLFGFGSMIGYPSLPFYVLSVFYIVSGILATIGLWKPGLDL